MVLRRNHNSSSGGSPHQNNDQRSLLHRLRKNDHHSPSSTSSHALVKAPSRSIVGKTSPGSRTHGADKKKNSTALTPYQARSVTKYDPRQNAHCSDDDEEELGNNRPVSMETKEIKIEHDDGRVETIQETTIKRPDGSTETFRMTDMPDSKSGNWQKKSDMMKNQPEFPMLTNGSSGSKPSSSQERKLLTNGSNNRKQNEPPKRITDGRQGRAAAGTTSNNNLGSTKRESPKLLTQGPVSNTCGQSGESTRLKTRGLVAYRGS